MLVIKKKKKSALLGVFSCRSQNAEGMEGAVWTLGYSRGGGGSELPPTYKKSTTVKTIKAAT